MILRLLESFSKASSMEINWEKLCVYWFDKYTYKSDWLLGYNGKCVEEGNIFKLLSTYFDLNLNTKDVD